MAVCGPIWIQVGWLFLGLFEIYVDEEDGVAAQTAKADKQNGGVLTKESLLLFIPCKGRDRKKASAALLSSDLYFPSLITVVPENGQHKPSASIEKQAGKYSAEALTWLLVCHHKQLRLSFQNVLI